MQNMWDRWLRLGLTVIYKTIFYNGICDTGLNYEQAYHKIASYHAHASIPRSLLKITLFACASNKIRHFKRLIT